MNVPSGCAPYGLASDFAGNRTADPPRRHVGAQLAFQQLVIRGIDGKAAAVDLAGHPHRIKEKRQESHFEHPICKRTSGVKQ